MKVHVIKRADDPTGTVRVSVGGHGLIPGAAYCVYRGRRKDAIDILSAALVELESAEETGKLEPKISPDNGKQYA